MRRSMKLAPIKIHHKRKYQIIEHCAWGASLSFLGALYQI